jgi:hypothetical protein
MNFWLLFAFGLTIGAHGYLGSGKSGIASFLTWLYQRSGRHVYRDTWLNPVFYPGSTQLDFDYLVKIALTQQPLPYPKGVMLLDEFQYEADARTSSFDAWQRALTYLKNQSRKRRTILIYTSEMRDYVELRYRENEVVIKCYKRHFVDDLSCDLANDVHNHNAGQICYKDECYRPHLFKYVFLYRHPGFGRRWAIWHPELIFPLYHTDALEVAAPSKMEKMLSKLGMTED